MQFKSRFDGLVSLSWFGLCTVLVASATVLLVFGDRFAWARELSDIPALWLAGGLMTAGLAYTLLFALIAASQRAAAPHKSAVLGVVILTGLALRLIMIPSVPALEDDVYRYLWDGAVVATGHNPYAVAPERAA